MSVIALLLVVIPLFLVFRGGIRSGRPLWTCGNPICETIRFGLALFWSCCLSASWSGYPCLSETAEKLSSNIEAKFHRPTLCRCESFNAAASILANA